MAAEKRILKMAQLEPFGSRHGMFVGSFSKLVEPIVTLDYMTEGEVFRGFGNEKRVDAMD